MRRAIASSLLLLAMTLGPGRNTRTALVSPPRREEVAQQRAGLGLADAAVDLGAVVAAGRGEVAHAAFHRAALRVGSAVIEAADAGERQGGGAHRAGFQRHVEVAVDQPLGAERRG